ncbi:hypothetical protein JCGZ_17999 [Jatropha curcas]|uniref:non-specific serine/threonine protein kinase n=1 Tax=Jatropha curcas TaxID=180498 RepID=A0A067JSA7_JATCU|nr:probable serine/threonine-protein kinase PIX13 [Jatropha curcas]KDP26841.1 hypothetical protein JCGZ_17999 [Jatropha curcas]
MGICWSCSAHDDRYPPLSSVDHVSTGKLSSGSGLQGTSKSLISWISQPSSSFTAIWGKNSQITASTIREDEAFDDGQTVINSDLRIFTFAQLKAATYNFRPDMVLGKGGFGSVYKGWLKERVPSRGIKKTAVAVKKLDSRSMQGIKEWKVEVHLLGSLSHPSLVKLLGYCWEDEKLLLVYEFMKNGSLNHHLFRKRSVRPLTWDTRLKIAIRTAQGLAYLHTLEKPIIYRDFKCSNILLDEFNNAKISDFGLAFFGPLTDNSHTTTRVMGTYGYAAPEYIATGQLFVKSDVYGFGVVLAEMLTGLRAFDTRRPSGQRNLVDWVKPHLINRRKLKNIMDSRLQGKYPPKEASKIAHLAVKCLQPNPILRPSMKEVAETLEQIEATSVRNVHLTK